MIHILLFFTVCIWEWIYLTPLQTSDFQIGHPGFSFRPLKQTVHLTYCVYLSEHQEN